MSWWITAQTDRASFNAAAHAEWLTRMRWARPVYMTAPDVKNPKRKFEQGSTLIVRTRLEDMTEAA